MNESQGNRHLKKKYTNRLLMQAHLRRMYDASYPDENGPEKDLCVGLKKMLKISISLARILFIF